MISISSTVCLPVWLDISIPLGAWHYATILFCRLAQNHAKDLEKGFEEVGEKLVTSLLDQGIQLEAWSIGHQKAEKRAKSPRPRTNVLSDNNQLQKAMVCGEEKVTIIVQKRVLKLEPQTHHSVNLPSIHSQNRVKYRYFRSSFARRDSERWSSSSDDHFG